MFRKHRICADYILLAMAALAQDKNKTAAKYMSKAFTSDDLVATLSEIASSNKKAFTDVKSPKSKLLAAKKSRALASKRRVRNARMLRRQLAELEESMPDDHNPDNEFMDDEYEESMPDDDMDLDLEMDDEFEESMPDDDMDLDLEMDDEFEEADDEYDMLEVESRVKRARRNRKGI